MISENRIFNEKGELRVIELVGDIIDTILIIVKVNPGIDIAKVNLELRKCGFFISHPILSKIWEHLINYGLLDSAFKTHLN